MLMVYGLLAFFDLLKYLNHFLDFYSFYYKNSKIGYMFTNIKPDGIFMEYYKNDIQKFWDEIDQLILNPKLFDTYLN